MISNETESSALKILLLPKMLIGKEDRLLQNVRAASKNLVPQQHGYVDMGSQPAISARTTGASSLLLQVL